MKAVFTTLITATLVALASAKAAFTNNQIDPLPGQAFTLTWSGGQAPYTIKLKNGPSTALLDVETLGSGLTTETLTWNVPKNLPADTYAFEVVDASGVPNYSAPFVYTPTETPSSKPATSSAQSTSAVSNTATTSVSARTSGATTTTSARTSATSSGSSTTTTAAPQETNVPGAAGRIASPLALVLVAISAMVFFN
jgi:hypothetical protein